MVNDQNNRELIEALDRCGDRMARFCEMSEFGPRHSGNTATATSTNSPASGLMILGAVLAGMNIMLVVVICLMGVKIIGMDDKLTAIYMLAPHLQPDPPK